jgi:hypothetical protein
MRIYIALLLGWSKMEHHQRLSRHSKAIASIFRIQRSSIENPSLKTRAINQRHPVYREAPQLRQLF